VSLVVLLVSFINYPVVAFIGFVGMMGATAVFVKNVRRIGNAGFKEVSEQLAAKDISLRPRRGFFDRFRRNP
jgi:hypothetical protein